MRTPDLKELLGCELIVILRRKRVWFAKGKLDAITGKEICLHGIFKNRKNRSFIWLPRPKSTDQVFVFGEVEQEKKGE